MYRRILVLILFFYSVVSFGQDKSVEPQTDFNINQVSAFPNPFNVESQIIFNSNRAQNILFEVKNVLGKVVYKKEIFAHKGKNSILFYKKNLTSGMYLYSIQTDVKTISKRLVIK